MPGRATKMTAGVAGLLLAPAFVLTAGMGTAHAGPACTTECYVDAANGDDLNGGASPEDPKKTIQAGVDAVTAGGTVHVAGGTYDQGVSIDKGLTLDGAGPGTVVQGDSDLGVDAGTGIAIESRTSNVAISDLTVQSFSVGISMVGEFIAGVSLTDVQSFSNARHGIWAAGGNGVFDLSLTRVHANNNGLNDITGRGLYVIDGAKQSISVVDGSFNNNRFAGIEIADGSVTDLAITANEVVGNGVAGITVVGAQGPGENLVANNTLVNTGRYGIQLNVPNGNGTATGDGAVVVRGNVVTRSFADADLRDHAGISVVRRSPGVLNADQPSGVVVTDNTVRGFHRALAGSTGDGFGIVVEGTSHTLDHNTVSDSDVGIQVQAGNPNPNAQDTEYFDRGDAHTSSAFVNWNRITGNMIQLRNIGEQTTDATCNWWGSADGPGPITGATAEPWLPSSDLDGPCGVRPMAEVTASAPTILEGSAAAFTVTLSRASSTPVTVAYTTQDGTATASASSIGGADYSSRSAELTFQPGDPLTQTLTVPTGNDAVDEADESFALLLTGASNADLGSTVASTVIGDNDLAPRIVIRDASVREGNPYAGSPTKDITFVVTLSAVSAKQVSTTWATRNGSGATAALGDAQSGDFVPGGGTLTIPPGSTRSAIVVTIRKDRARERDEHFFVLLSQLLNTRLGDGTSRGGILNDD